MISITDAASTSFLRTANVALSFAGAQDFACELRRSQIGSSSTPAAVTLIPVFHYRVQKGCAWPNDLRRAIVTAAKSLPTAAVHEASVSLSASAALTCCCILELLQFDLCSCI